MAAIAARPLRSSSVRCRRSSRLCRASIGGPAAAAAAEALLALVEFGELGRLAGGQRRGRGLDARQQVVRRGDDRGARAVECARQLGERPAPLGELWVGGEQAGPREVAAGGDGGLRGLVSASAPSATSASVSGGSGDRSELDAHTPRRDRDEVDRHEVGKRR